MTTPSKPFILGAVAYDAKVVPIWEGFKTYFESAGLPFDFVLYSNYEKQVEAHLRGDIDVAWNSPLAWLEAERAARKLGRTAQAIAMRDTDCDLTSVVLVRADGPKQVAELSGKRIGVGASDSPQATLIPLVALAEAGVEGQVVRHEVMPGKHGDHVGGERDAARALMQGSVDAACMIDSNHLQFTREGTLQHGATRVLAQTAPYDHCNFTVLDDAPTALIERFVALLLGMRYDDAAVRPLLDLEGLKAWQPGRTTGYALLERACERTGWLQPFLRRLGAA